MLVGDLRKLLTNYLNGFLRIDEWGLGLPKSIQNLDNPPSIGLDKPALDLVFDETGVGYGNDHQRYATTTIPFQIIYRFDSSYKYNNLPRAEAENVLCQIILDLISYHCLNKDIEELKPTGSVSVAETKNSDWLLIIEIDFFAKFDVSRNPQKSKIFMT